MIEALWSAEHGANHALLRRAVAESDLEGALFAIQTGTTGVSAAHVERARSVLDALGMAIASASAADDRIPAPTVLARALVEAGFRGDEASYHDVASSLLTAVLERRTGMPILLSAVWILGAARAGILVDGIGLPGHFVVRVGGDDGVLCDPFRQGAILTLGDCRALVRRFAAPPLDAGDLRPASVSSMASRVLRNLMGSLASEGNPVAGYRASVLLCGLSPDDPRAHLARAQLAETNRGRVEALAAFDDLGNRFPDESSLQRAARDGRARVLGWGRGN